MLDLEGKTMKTVDKAADIVIINLLFILTSLPVVTIGASASAMCYVMQRLSKNEEGYTAKDYFKAFWQNLKKGTQLWLLMLPVLVLMVWNIWALMVNYRLFPGWIVGLTGMGSLIVLMVMLYIFPLQAHFENSIGNTIKNAVTVMLLNLPRSLLMLLVFFAPAAAVAISYSSLVAVLFCGFSLPAYISCFLYRKMFERMSQSSS